MIKSKFRREVILIYLILLLFLVKSDIFASIEGLEEPIKGSSSDCYIYKHYAVSVRSSGRIGDIITVRKPGGQNEANCDALSKEVIMRIDGTDSTETFMGLYKHFIFTDSGTGPDGRGISIYDLNKQKSVYYATYCGGDMKIENNALTLYKEVEPKRKVDCTVPGWPGPIGYEQEIRVNLESLREEPIGKITCSPRQ